MSATESTLLKRARHFDREAWSTIYDQNYPRVYAFLVTRVRDGMLAEDLAADVFVNALRSIDSYEERGLGLAAWLFRIAHNRLIDHYRRAGVRPSTSLDELEPENGAGVDLEMPSASVHEQIDLQKALLQLNDEQQQVIHLRFVEGFTSEQVASVMSKSIGAVKIIQHRALKTLKKCLRTG
jgi:RNA polymerase sigma-70 factor (ECF subfamily)